MGLRIRNTPAYRFSKTPNYIWKAGATIGENNEFVYKELLGHSDEDIANFLVEGVITTEADVVALKPRWDSRRRALLL